MNVDVYVCNYGLCEVPLRPFSYLRLQSLDLGPSSPAPVVGCRRLPRGRGELATRGAFLCCFFAHVHWYVLRSILYARMCIAFIVSTIYFGGDLNIDVYFFWRACDHGRFPTSDSGHFNRESGQL